MTNKTEVELLLLMVRGYKHSNEVGDLCYSCVALFNPHCFALAVRAHRIANGNIGLFHELGCAVDAWAAQKPSLRFHPEAFNFSGFQDYYGGNRFTISLPRALYDKMVADRHVIFAAPGPDVAYLQWGMAVFDDFVSFYFCGKNGAD